MFERRLKWILFLIAGGSVLLLARVAQVQVLDRSEYSALAERIMTRQRLIETTRGSIVDFRGRVLAEDTACVDAAVDYRAVTTDTSRRFVRAWIDEIALARLRERPGSGYAAADGPQRAILRQQEREKVQREIEQMWPRLAQLSGQTMADIEDARARIDLQVKRRQRQNTYRRYQYAVNQKAKSPRPPWYQRWLVAGDTAEMSEDEFDTQIEEQLTPHVVLRALSPEAQLELGKNIDKYPGLVLIPSTRRNYPFGREAAHAIGYLSLASKEDLDGEIDSDDDLRAYQPNDLVGRSGIESLAERVLRGTRGRESSLSGELRAEESSPPLPGRTVVSTIDIALQAELREAFEHVRVPHPDSNSREFIELPMHGAAVVIDVPTGEVRALVSYPDFDLNGVRERMRELEADVDAAPLFNRATLSQMLPGSSVKPMVGLSAMAAGVATLTERIECTGYLIIRGRKYPNGRCWTMTMPGQGYSHHSIPTPHTGPTPELNGFLNFTEAIERSCNIYFENMADRLGTERLSAGLEQFGLGRPTGIGISEVAGRLPRQFKGPASLFATWTAGIGQSSVLATPLQICNGMATIARDGVWVRPKLVRDIDPQMLSPSGGPNAWPERFDLNLPPDALAAAKRGMVAVVQSPAGSGHEFVRRDFVYAAKSGTAQAEKFRRVLRDADGAPILDASGHRQWVEQRASTWSNLNPELPWYRASDEEGQKVHHAWFVGFAPAENPRIAFAVVVQYGGAGGGRVAGPIASKLLDACVKHGYLPGHPQASNDR